MRVLLVANTLPPRDLSGVGEQVLQLASGLRADGHDVEILGRGPDGAPGPKLLFPLTVSVAFLRRLQTFRPHVVQVHESDGAVVAMLARTMAALCHPRPLLVALLQVSYIEEIRAVRTLRVGDRVLSRPGAAEIRFRFLKAPLHVVLGCLTAWLADAVLAPSRVTADEIARDYGIGSVGIVPNVTGGLDWDDAGTAPAELRDDGLLFVGRLRIRKGVEVLLHAVKELRSAFPDVRLSIVGDGEQRLALEAMVRDLDLGTVVRILGRQSPAEVRRLL
ncbi:MAG: glycosyltransferase family 4 protein, partial [Acidobacteriota bacterium]|nr:glycosyltransferase family 4 protein [Acidobacteriota bacterium]